MDDNKCLCLMISPPCSPGLKPSRSDSLVSLPQDQIALFAANFEVERVEQPLDQLFTTGVDTNRPTLSAHKRYLSFPLSTLESKAHQATSYSAAEHSCQETALGLGINVVPETPSNFSSNITFGSSEPVSPVSSMMSSPPTRQDLLEQNQELDGFDILTEGLEEREEGRPLSAAKIRARKRKMKRFRLSHQHTRYLMSEFARQAHPDAAHRERLAREIPGLSSRQVQVWFQNRRAKLKRLTQDDREHVVRSRALPDNFDMAQALQSPFIATHGVISPIRASTHHRPHSFDSNVYRQSTLDTISQQDVGLLSPDDMCTTAFPDVDQPQILNELSPPFPLTDMHSPFGTFSPTSFACDISSGLDNTLTYELDTTSLATCPQTPHFHANQSAAHTGIDSNHFAPDISAYGLGFSRAEIPGFQSRSNVNIKNLKHPGKVMIPRRISGNRPIALQVPSYPSFVTPPLSTSATFSILSAPAGVTSFPQYMQ